MIDKKIMELFDTISNSNEYIDYKKYEKLLIDNKEIMKLIEEIKKFQKEATLLQVNKDNKYKEIDKIVNNKLDILKSFPLYNEYINKKEELNDILAMVSKMLNDYIEEKIE